MALPETIPTVTVTGRYLRPDGTPLSGSVVWRAPALVTIGDADVMLSGPVTAELDANGAFSVELPATDAPGMVPSGWSYTVTEQLAGVGTQRAGYQILLPAESPAVDLADLAPTDPTTPTYVAVRGDSAYEVAVEDGFTGTVSEWLASLVGPQGETGPTGPQGETGPMGPQGETGPAGAPGVVQSVNGQSAAEVILGAADVGAVPDTAPGAAGGVAQLDASGVVPAEQLPADIGGGAVDSVNGQTGAVVLDAAGVGAIPTAERGTADGVATLDSTGRLTPAQAPADPAAHTFAPGDLGFTAWAFDPAAGTSGGRYPSHQSFRLAAVVIREPVTVSAIAWHVFGYSGTGLQSGSCAGVFDSAGVRLRDTANMTGEAVIPGVHNVGGQTVTAALDSPLALAAGVYYVAWYFRVDDVAKDGPALMAAESSQACPVVSLNGVHRFGLISNLTSWPASFNPADLEDDPVRYWAALV